MDVKQLFVNALRSRFIQQFAPGSMDSKRPAAWLDYGYPQYPDFDTYYSMYQRNGIARAGVIRHVEKTWQTFPAILESDEQHDPTKWELDLEAMFERLDFFKMLKGADERNRVGQYAGLVFIFADGKEPHEPVDRVPGGLNGLVKIIPAFQSQLEPSAYVSDPRSPRYGEPETYSFNESEIGDRSTDNPGRVLTLHHTRVHIWAEGADDGSIFGTPALKAGLNALLTMEKIVGAGGEGFWKTARAPMQMNVDPQANLQSLAAMMGVEVDGIPDKLDEILRDFYSGADKSLLLQGIDSKPLSISLPSPREFFNVALEEFAASLPCPLPILMGHQTGDRASQEDSNEWNSTIMARRETLAKPEIRRIIRYLMDVGVIRERAFVVDWDDLTAPSQEDKLALADKMADINQKMLGRGDAVFSADEMREVVGYEPNEADGDFDEEDDFDPEADELNAE